MQSAWQSFRGDPAELVGVDSNAGKRLAEIIESKGDFTKTSPRPNNSQHVHQDVHQHVHHHQAMGSDELRQEVQELRVEIAELRKYLQEDLEQQFKKQNVILVRCVEDRLSQSAAATQTVVADESLSKPRRESTLEVQPAKQEVGKLNSSAKQTQTVDMSNAAREDFGRFQGRSLTSVVDVISQGHLFSDLHPNIVSQPAMGSTETDTWKLVHSYESDSQYTWFELAYHRKLCAKSGPQALLHLIGLGDKLGGHTRPANCLVTFVRSKPFETVGWLAVMLNAIFITFQMQYGVQKVLSSSEHYEDPTWMKRIDTGFLIFFAAEALLKLIALRTWFFTSPREWKWNVFDLFLVAVSVSSSFDIVFLRSLRVTRVLRQLRSLKSMRLLRVVGGVGALAELRRLLKAVEACMASLFWSILFLAMVMYFFSIFIMAGIVGNSDQVQGDPDLRATMEKKFGGIVACCKTLLVVIGGPEWAESFDSLSQISAFEAIIVPVYLLLVQIGVLNIIIGVFAEAAASTNQERDLVAQDQIGEVEAFVGDMMALFQSWTPDGKTQLNWEEFKEYMYKEDVQAYLAAHDVDTSHAQVLFFICDKDKTGYVDMHLFVLGLLRLRGAAKSLDAKIMVHSLSALESSLLLLRQLITPSGKLQPEEATCV